MERDNKGRFIKGHSVIGGFIKGQCSQFGEAHPFYGKHHSEETKQKIRQARQGKGHPIPQETRNKISLARQGKGFSELHRKHLREAIKNRPPIGKPNKIEQALINLVKKNNLPCKFVGNGEVWLGSRNPDFISTNGKKQVIELFGTYWHPVFDMADRVEHYKQYGFDVLIIWEDELRKPDKVIKKIKKFLGKC